MRGGVALRVVGLGAAEPCAEGLGDTLARSVFRGFALNPVDPKGRVAIPLAFRKQIETSIGRPSVIVSPHPTLPCLTLYDEAWAEEMFARIDRHHEAQASAGQAIDDDLTRTLAANAEDAAYDASGRFILTPFFRSTAGITDLAFFAGNASTFEIWNPETLIACDEVNARTRETCRWHLENRGAK